MTKRGRPPKAAADKQDSAIYVYCTADQKGLLAAAAELAGLSVSGFALQAALKAARRVSRQS